MRAFVLASAAALLLAGCETAFVGRAPSGRFALAEVDGRAVPPAAAPAQGCGPVLHDGWFELDSLARRWEMQLSHRDSCSGQTVRETRETGSYLRRDGRLTLESADSRRWIATEGGRTIGLRYDGRRLLFRQPERPRP
ncbi:hypothetical protein [Allosphingosinicella sp.]|jgi:hypothetical protein|uniref:hypothetical protein n=1 Tax=Allosphingosinicella sp. TaxID=2823234 RepID=UPI002F0603D7